MTTTSSRMQDTVDTRANWRSVNPVRLAGERCWDSTIKKSKTWDGTTAWSGLPYDGEDPNILNPKNYGAKFDGSTDDGQAWLDMFTDTIAGARNDFNPYGDYRLQRSVVVPPGTSLIQGNGKVIADILTQYYTGLYFHGWGLDAAEIVFQPGAANGFALFNNDRLYHLTMDNLSFYVDGSDAASATLFKSVSNGHAQNYAFHRVQFGGTAKYGLALLAPAGLAGNNNSEMKFHQCQFHMNHPGGGAFLYSPAPGVGSASDQSVNFQVKDCDIEYATGDFVQLAAGGCVNISGGSLIHAGDGTQTTSTRQRFVSMLGATHDAGCDSVSIRDVRVEMRHNNSQLLYSERARGNIVIDNVNDETDAWLLTAPQNVKQIEIVGSPGGSYPQLSVTNSMLMGQQVIHYNSNSYLARPKMSYEKCNFVDAVNEYKRAVDFFSFVADGGGTTSACIPVVSIEKCHAQFDDQTEVFDTELNWHTAINTPLTTKQVSVRGAGGGLPVTGTPATVKLPINAVITRIRAAKAAGGTDAGTTFTYTLTDASATQIAQAAPGVAWNTAWAYDPVPLWRPLDTDAKRTLTLTAANIAETSASSYFIIDYIG